MLRNYITYKLIYVPAPVIFAFSPPHCGIVTFNKKYVFCRDPCSDIKVLKPLEFPKR